jgi:hypothetical protein
MPSFRRLDPEATLAHSVQISPPCNEMRFKPRTCKESTEVAANAATADYRKLGLVKGHD